MAVLERGRPGTWHMTSGGQCTWYEFALVRYNPNGSLDTSFDSDGKV